MKKSKVSVIIYAFLFAVIPAVFNYVGIHTAIIPDNKAEVTHIDSAYGGKTGYAVEPQEWTVTASPHYKWEHGTKPAAWQVIVAVILFLAAGFYCWYVEAQFKTGTWVVLAICWLGGTGLLVGKHSFRYYESKTYERTISDSTYQQNVNNLDKLFDVPAAENQVNE